MTDKETEITTPAALAAWAGYHRPEMEISEKGAGLLLGYLDGHGYRLLEKDGMMMWRDIGTGDGRTVPASLDKVVDMVFRWNGDMLEENRQKMDDPKNEDEMWEQWEEYLSLHQDSDEIFSMYERTEYGKQFQRLSKELNKIKSSGTPERGPDSGGRSR